MMLGAVFIGVLLWIAAAIAIRALATRDGQIADRAGKGNAAASGSPDQRRRP